MRRRWDPLGVVVVLIALTFCVMLLMAMADALHSPAEGRVTQGSAGYTIPPAEGEVVAAMKAQIREASLPRPEPAPAPEVPSPSDASGVPAWPWGALAQCESHGEWDYNEHSGWGSGLYDGGLQFSPDTWLAFGGGEYAPTADLASPETQVRVAERVLAAQGWRAWPACSLELGLR